MSVSKAKLSVYFEGPFWVGLYQREDGEGLRVCRVTFGAEPRDQEVLDYFQRHWRELNFSPPVGGDAESGPPSNPKRARREARRAVRPTGAGTKAQQAVQLQREQAKTQRKAVSKERREAEQARKFALRQQKRREKHRGR